MDSVCCDANQKETWHLGTANNLEHHRIRAEGASRFTINVPRAQTVHSKIVISTVKECKKNEEREAEPKHASAEPNLNRRHEA